MTPDEAAATPVERGTTRRRCWRCRFAPPVPGEPGRVCTNHKAPGFGRFVPPDAVCAEFAARGPQARDRNR